MKLQGRHFSCSSVVMVFSESKFVVCLKLFVAMFKFKTRHFLGVGSKISKLHSFGRNHPMTTIANLLPGSPS